MKQTLRLVAAFLVAAVSLGFGQPQARAADGPAIWEMRGPSANIMLLGSVHLLRESDYPLPDNIARAMERAECLVFELDMDDLDPVMSQTLFQNLGRVPDGTSLPEILGADNYAVASGKSRELGIELDLLSEFKPWFAALTIMNLQLMRLGFVPQLGLDQQLAAAAVSAGKEVTGLETLEFQIELFDGMPDPVQVQLLMQTLHEADLLENQMGLLVGAWRDGKTDVLARELGRNFSEYPELYRSLVTERNASWANQLIEMGNGDRECLVVVGALHLVGKGSLIDLLRDKGAQVVRW
ncbi:MAG: TraB/GumN family protein [Gammaproteobacteria bacterium]